MQTENNNNKPNKTEGFIPPHGGYRDLLTYKKSEIIYDGTVYFTNRFFGKYDRTVGQMVQAARSGKQNIVEASVASGTSKEMEIKLTNVARASLEELLIDYQDFLRTKKLSIWHKDHKLVTRLRELNRTPDANYDTFKKAIENPSPEICANAMISLINITTYLLKRQIDSLEKTFLQEGGMRERMTKARIEIRNRGRG
ncbi:MAG: four helix bundle suffix domain-containing protein [Bacteroidetes bacterium]|nr:four helix bundle suffix domain-containing protein [Bacteroidota bacterium]